MKTTKTVGRMIIVAAAVALSFLGGKAKADSIGSATSVGYAGSGSNVCSNTGSGSPKNISSCSGMWTGADITGTGSAQSYAMYGVLGATSTATTSVSGIGGYGDGTQSAAQASWDDTLSFSNLSQTDYLQAVVSLAGIVSPAVCTLGSSTCSSESDYDVYFNNGYAPGSGCTLTSAGTCTLTLQITDDSLVDFSGLLFVDSAANIACCGGGEISVTTNFYNTAMVTSLTIVDANGRPVQGADILSESGTDYNTLSEPTTVTPEPSSILLFGAGCFGLIAIANFKSVGT